MILDRTIRLVAGSALLLGAGCALGPNFKPPSAPNVAGYTATPLPATTGAANVAGGGAQRFVAGRDIPGEWWTLFRSPPLNRLIERALTNNPDLMAAQAALRVARESVLTHRGVFLPGAVAGLAASRQKQSAILAPVPNYPVVPQEFQFDLFTPQVSVSYVPDVFGLNRRTQESLRAQESAVRFQLIATYITLSANVTVAAIQEASLRAQVEATRQLIGINSNMVRVLLYQFAKGYASRLDLAAQESQLAQVTATLPPLRKQLAQQRHLLAALTGRFPSQAPADELELASLHLPRELPLSMPSQLVAQRPDVRQAEANLHAASAQIGIAIANRLPNITLSANAGSTALAIDRVFASGTGFWGLGAGAAAPIFQGGALLHQERAAKAAYVQAAEQYRSTVLTAFQNVADTLNALEQDAEALKTAAAAKAAAGLTLQMARKEFQAGYVSYLTLLNAEQSYRQTELALAQAQANRYSDTVALLQALGGGWWHRPKLAGR